MSKSSWIISLLIASINFKSFAQIAPQLIEFGFENIVENNTSDTYTLFYEDNLYRFPADGLYNLLTILEIENLKPKNTIVLLNKGIALLEVEFTKADFEKFKTKKIDAEDFVSQLKIHFTNKTYDSENALNKSYFKTDISLRFELDYTLGNFDNPIRQRLNIQPLLDTDLAKGVNFNAYYNIPKFDEMGSVPREPQVGLLKLSNDVKIDQSTFLNLNFGFFNYNRFGITMNYLKFLYEDALRFNLHSGLTRFGRLNKDLLLYYDLNFDFLFDAYGDLTYRWRKYDMDVTFRYGSFVNRDFGYSVLVRRFALQRFVGLFYKKTNFGTMVGFDFSIPIPIKKYNRKWPVRLKTYDQFYLPYNYRSDSEVAHLYYQGDNVISQMTNYFPSIIKKGLINAIKKGGK